MQGAQTAGNRAEPAHQEAPPNRVYRFHAGRDLIHTARAILDGYLCLVIETPIWRKLRAQAWR